MVAAFIVIPLLLAAAFVWGIAWSWQRSGAAPQVTIRAAMLAALGVIGWMSATWIAAQSGLLRRWGHVPPPFGLLVLATLLVAFVIAFTTPGRRLAQFVPLWALVAVQAFRLPLELAMHQLADRGIMPPQMTYTGRNFDILTGASALIVAVIAARGRGRVLVTAWNVIGLALLTNVVVIAILSTPTFRYFGEDRLNVFVTSTPYVWLPAVMVLAALAGHLVIFRAVRLQSR